MKEQHYKQVWIESEDDLPKVNGEYFAHARSRDRIITMHWWDSEGQYGIDVWMRTVDWYLAEVEQTEKTDQELKEIACKLIMDNIDEIAHNSARFINAINKTDEQLLKLKKDELVKLFRQSFNILMTKIKEDKVESKGLTDEEITNSRPYLEKEASTPQMWKNIGFIMGAKWARDQIQGNEQTAKLKELVKAYEELDEITVDIMVHNAGNAMAGTGIYEIPKNEANRAQKLRKRIAELNNNLK